MKIALISPNPIHLREMATTLTRLSHEVLTYEGGKARMRAVAEEELPDLMVVDGMCCDAAELNQVEHVSTHHASMAVVLLCSTHTPEFLIQSMRAGVREVLPSPASAEALGDMVSRVESKLKGARGKSGGQVLAFLPCKGGSGATFLATNLGWHLAQSSSVLLIDLNLQFGDALSVLHDGKPVSTLADVTEGINRLDATFLAASAVSITPNYSILAAPEDPSRAVAITPEHVDAILALATTQYDFVLLDMSRHIDPVSIRALDRAHRIFAVIQMGLPAVRNAKQFLTMFQSLGYPREKTELIVNRFDKTSTIGLDDLRRSFGDVMLRTVPNAFRDVSSSIDQGMALVKLARSSSVVRTLTDFAESLKPRSATGRSLFDRLLRRA